MAASKANKTTFKKGVSGNPGGRSKMPSEVKRVLEKNTLRAIECVLQIMNDVKNKASDRIKAAEFIVDRAYGRPAQLVEHSGDAENPITVKDMTNAQLADIIANAASGPGAG
jgi:hypothetical protein